MGRVITAFRAFFAALFNADAANRIRQALDHHAIAAPKSDTPAAKVAIPPTQHVVVRPQQSEALTLLSTLQREARLVDFLKEDLSAYSDDQVGAAVREIHRESQAVLDRLFAVRPILTEEEGATVSVPSGFNAARYRLTGKLAGQAPFQGTLRHHGWEATKCEIPEFVGNELSATTIAPAEVEIV